MKLRIVSLVLASIFTISALLGLFIINIDKVRWDKVPIISFFVLEIELWPAGFDASDLEEPITWDQLDEEPEGYTGNWFAFNTYTKNLLKDYMKENNLGIVPDCWPDFKFRSNFEECLETFEFVELDESYRVEVKEPIIGKIIVAALGCFAVAFWIVFLYQLRRQ